MSCGKTGSARASFEVGRKLVPAAVVVQNSGFTQSLSGNEITYGVVLTNTSADEDALDVATSVSFTDTQNRSTVTQSRSITGIPAGGTFYLSSYVFPNVSLTVASLAVTVKVGLSQPKRLVLPPVKNVQMDSFGEVTGDLTNPYAKPLPETATVYAVVFDAQGNVLGGDSVETRAQVQPGATVEFDLLPFMTLERAASVQVSVDPCGFLAPECDFLSS